MSAPTPPPTLPVEAEGAHENAPATGSQWAPCLCAEIDAADRPCVVCAARYGAPFAAVIQ